jgi:hypothetical protein
MTTFDRPHDDTHKKHDAQDRHAALVFIVPHRIVYCRGGFPQERCKSDRDQDGNEPFHLPLSLVAGRTAPRKDAAAEHHRSPAAAAGETLNPEKP